jgi:hypothetical protein
VIDPDAFEACFSRWARSLAVGAEREVVAAGFTHEIAKVDQLAYGISN